MEGRICPLMSSGVKGMYNCKGEGCMLWSGAYNDCIVNYTARALIRWTLLAQPENNPPIEFAKTTAGRLLEEMKEEEPKEDDPTNP